MLLNKNHEPLNIQNSEMKSIWHCLFGGQQYEWAENLIYAHICSLTDKHAINDKIVDFPFIWSGKKKKLIAEMFGVE